MAFLIPVISLLSTQKGKLPENPVDGRGALPSAIILAPTRELASQIHLDARRLTFGAAVKSVCVYGGNDIRTQLMELCSGCDVIVATPGRLNDLCERGIVSLSQVSFLVLDEADRMLDMGFEVSIFILFRVSFTRCRYC
jgi:ATP-dependent RNA helicase DDX3X